MTRFSTREARGSWPCYSDARWEQRGCIRRGGRRSSCGQGRLSLAPTAPGRIRDTACSGWPGWGQVVVTCLRSFLPMLCCSSKVAPAKGSSCSGLPAGGGAVRAQECVPSPSRSTPGHRPRHEVRTRGTGHLRHKGTRARLTLRPSHQAAASAFVCQHPTPRDFTSDASPHHPQPCRDPSPAHLTGNTSPGWQQRHNALATASAAEQPQQQRVLHGPL